MQNFKKVTGLISVLVFMLGYVAAAGAGANTYKIIDHAALKAKIEADQRNFLLVDARNPAASRLSMSGIQKNSMKGTFQVP